MASLVQISAFFVVLSLWFGGLYYFFLYKQDQKPQQNQTNQDNSDGEREDAGSADGSEDEGIPQDQQQQRGNNNVRNRRQQQEDEKLDQQEMENNEYIREMENMLKEGNKQNFTKKELQKMEKKLEKAQLQAARLAAIKEQREAKEAQIKKQEELDAQRQEEEEEAEIQRQKELKAHNNFGKSEYQRWEDSFVTVKTAKAPTYKSVEEKKQALGPDFMKKMSQKENRPISLESVALDLNITIDEVKELINQSCQGLYVQDGKSYLSFSEAELESIAKGINDQGRISRDQIQSLVSKVLGK